MNQVTLHSFLSLSRSNLHELECRSSFNIETCKNKYRPDEFGGLSILAPYVLLTFKITTPGAKLLDAEHEEEQTIAFSIIIYSFQSYGNPRFQYHQFRTIKIHNTPSSAQNGGTYLV